MIRANDPCPCGSGKKYKKCCGATERAAAPPPRRSTPRAAPPPRAAAYSEPRAESGPKRRQLALLAGVLNREAGLLQHYPYILPAQLFNRLHGEEGTRSLLSKARRALTERPWAELKNRMAGIGQATMRVLDRVNGALAFSPDGTRLGAADGSLVRLFDTATGRCVDELPYELGATPSVVEWSADGRWLVVAGAGGLWISELASRKSRSYGREGVETWMRVRSPGAVATAGILSEAGQPARRFERGPVAAQVMAWSPDGSWLADGDSYGEIRIWSLAEPGSPAAKLRLGIVTPHRLRAYAITGLAWAPGEPLLAAAAHDGTVSFFAPDPWQEVARVKLADTFLGPLAWSPDGKDLVVGRGNVVDLLDVRSSLRRGSLEGQSDWTRTREYLGTRAAAAPTVVGTFEGHTEPIAALAWTPDGSVFASSGLDNTVRLWSADAMKRGGTSRAAGRRKSGEGASEESRSLPELLDEDPDRAAELLIAEIPKLPSVKGGVPSPDGNLVAIGKEDGEVRISSVDGDGADRLLREGWTEAKAAEYARAMRSRPSGFFDLTPSIGGYQLRINDPDYSPVRSLAWSPDGRFLAAAGLKFGLEIHDLEGGAVRSLVSGAGLLELSHLAWSPDGKWLASAGGARNILMEQPFLIQLWDPKAGTVRRVFEGDASWSALAWAPDGSLLGFADEERSVRAFSPSDERTLLLARSLSPVTQLCFVAGAPYLTAVDDGAGTGSNPQAYVWKLHNFSPRLLRRELERIEALGGRRAVVGGPRATQRENPVEVSVLPPEAPVRQSAPPAPAAPPSPLERPAPSWLEAHAMLGVQAQERRRRGHEVSNQALELLQAERFEEALVPLQEVVEIWRELWDHELLRPALGDQGTALFRLGRYDAALEAWREEETLCRRLDNRGALARSLSDQARALVGRQEWSAALEPLREEAPLREAAGEREELAHCFGFQGWILARIEQRDQAIQAMERQETVLRELDDRAKLAEGLLKQVELLLMIGATAKAKDHARESAALFAELDRPADEARARALALKARVGRPTPLKGIVVLLVMLAPAGIGIGLGLWNAWLWILGGPLVLVSAFMVIAGMSPRLRQGIEQRARRSLGS